MTIFSCESTQPHPPTGVDHAPFREGGTRRDHRPPESMSLRPLCAQSSFASRSEGEEGLLEEVAFELGPERGARASWREAQAVSAGSWEHLGGAGGLGDWGPSTQSPEYLDIQGIVFPKDLSSMNSTCSLPLLYSRP